MNRTAQALQSGTPNPYRYNGKELQTFLQVAGRSLEWYDYGARFYEPEVGRWQTVDPLAEWDFKSTPYVYCKNNPLLFIDPSGMKDSLGTAKNPIPIKPVVIQGKKPSWWKRFKRKMGQIFSNDTEGGVPFVMSKGGPEPTQRRAKHPDEPVSLEYFFLFLRGLEAGPLESPGNMNFGPALDNVKDASEEVKEAVNETSDKDIKESTTGDKTGNGGKPIPSSSSSSTSTSTIIVGDDQDSSLYQSSRDGYGTNFKYAHPGDTLVYDAKSKGFVRKPGPKSK